MLLLATAATSPAHLVPWLENRKNDFKEWDPFSGVTYVLTSLNFKACRFAYNEEEAMSLSVFCYLRFSLSLSGFQAIFVSFVTISVVQCYKAMSLVGILSWQGLRNVMEAFAYTFLVSNSRYAALYLVL